MSASLQFQSLVVPFDFSPAAHNALFRAVDIGRRSQLPVELWLLDDKYARKQLLEEDPKGNFKELAEKALEANYRQFNQDGRVKVHHQWLEGKAARAIQLKLKESPHVLIFLGIHGERKQDGIFHGSQANKFSLMWKTPVLAIPPGLEKGFQRMLLAIDAENLHSREKIPYALFLGQFSESEATLLGLEKRSNKEDKARLRGMLHQASKYFEKKGIPHRQAILQSRNPGSATLKYAEDHQIDLVVLVADSDGPLAALMGPSFPSFVSQRFQGLCLCVPPKVTTITAKVTI